MIVTKKNGQEIHVFEEMWFPEVSENSEPIMTMCFVHDLSDYSTAKETNIRKCAIQKETGSTQEKIFSKIYTVQEEKNSPLTDRELQILGLLSDGLTNEQVAERLYISENTIKTHRKNILLNIGVHKMSEAVKISVKNGWLS
jgi:DNA-binding NarL/FixJ family response regulator